MLSSHLPDVTTSEHVGPARGLSRLVVDEDAREVFLNGSAVFLTRTEFDLLAMLCRNPRRVMTPEMLLTQLWSSSWTHHSHPIEVYVHRLRKKLGESGKQARYIHTVRGVGYRFEPDQEDQITDITVVHNETIMHFDAESVHECKLRLTLTWECQLNRSNRLGM